MTTNIYIADAVRQFVNEHRDSMDAFVKRFEEIYGKEKETAICNLSQEDYDNLVRDALKWRSSKEPMRFALQRFCNAFTNNAKTSSLRDWNFRMKEAYDNAVLALGGYSEPLPTGKVIVDEKIFNQAHGLREEWPNGPTPYADGPTAAEANEILGKHGHYKDGPKDP